MPIAYSRSVENPSGIIRFFNGLGAYWQGQSLYYYCIAIYLLPNLLAALLFLFPFFRRSMEMSNTLVIIILMWWAQPKLYIGRGMHEDTITLLKEITKILGRESPKQILLKCVHFDTL